MSNFTQYNTLFAYHWHTIDRLMNCASRLDPEDYMDDPGYGRGSIHNLLFHILRTDRSWRIGLETGKQLAPIQQEGYPSLDSLKVGFEQEKSAWLDLLQKTNEIEINGDIDLTDRRGEIYSIPRWSILQHLILHGMQHQTEIAQLLTAKGESPGDLDFIFF
jgi:uncharacterized damage-inducible protein DinB